MIELSVCIVNYQAKDYLRDCLNSLYEHTTLSFDVIVVDNGSSDGSLEMLKDQLRNLIPSLIANQNEETPPPHY